MHFGIIFAARDDHLDSHIHSNDPSGDLKHLGG